MSYDTFPEGTFSNPSVFHPFISERLDYRPKIYLYEESCQQNVDELLSPFNTK